ncbi:MAG: hypothetical protein AAB425_10780 [Bdellovibrionota bacterium]
MADLESMLNKNKTRASRVAPAAKKPLKKPVKKAETLRTGEKRKSPTKPKPRVSSVNRDGDARRPWQHDDRVEQATARVIEEAKVLREKARKTVGAGFSFFSEAALAAASLASKREMSWEIPLGDLNAQVRDYVKTSRKRLANGTCRISPLVSLLPRGLKSRLGLAT